MIADLRRINETIMGIEPMRENTIMLEIISLTTRTNSDESQIRCILKFFSPISHVYICDAKQNEKRYGMVYRSNKHYSPSIATLEIKADLE
jgi:hypothetical protein